MSLLGAMTRRVLVHFGGALRECGSQGELRHSPQGDLVSCSTALQFGEEVRLPRPLLRLRQLAHELHHGPAQPPDPGHEVARIAGLHDGDLHLLGSLARAVSKPVGSAWRNTPGSSL
ncbi:hypothetical protein D7Y13_01735 [Corallococcus praedator]|uniref:Uncharacterized protein n=1 Tax=Corallococcus praedator TaxID=2316724 RepID=A0ABX9QRG8_9BACT|nr:hypothetical protein D7X74_03775 [Corallococcus sp. CA047B]RKH36152.1 hypothetical protein D7X75_01775 [Corallococcus sp. CA031C]RKI17012.1 hypothetical protein D7Y13_01735 [Corallococcus praedator]